LRRESPAHFCPRIYGTSANLENSFGVITRRAPGIHHSFVAGALALVDHAAFYPPLEKREPEHGPLKADTTTVGGGLSSCPAWPP
jgi:hypothetical protein